MLEEAKDLAMRQVVGFGALFAIMVLLGHNDRQEENFGPTQMIATSEASEDDREGDMDVGDPEEPPEEDVQFCVNNREKFKQEFTIGGGERGAYCRLLLRDLPCSRDDCPDDPYAMYEDVWDSEERPDTTNGI